MSSDRELYALRQKRMLELQRQLEQEQEQAKTQGRLEDQKQDLLRAILATDARQRLNRIKLVRPDFAAQLEVQLIQIAQTGKVALPITDEQLKSILSRVQPQKKEIRFQFK